MAFTIDWSTSPPTITVPQADLTPLGGGLYEHDTDAFWDEIKALEASEEGIVFDDLQFRNAPVTIAGVTFAPAVALAGLAQVQYEDTGSFYTVVLAGTNNDIWSKEDLVYLPHANVAVSPTNSAGLQETGVSGLTSAEAANLELLRKFIENRNELAEGSVGNFVIYDDDGVTPLVVQDVTDKDGNAITLPDETPAKRSAKTN